MDMHDSSSILKFKDYPILLWIIGLAFFIPGVFVVLKPQGWVQGLIMMVLGVLIGLVLASVRSITADRTRGVLTVRHRNLIRNKVIEINLNEIANFSVEASRTRYTGGAHRAHTYRIVAVKTSGETVPMAQEYSSGYDAKAKRARQLCAFLGLPGWEDKPTNLFQAARQMQQAISRPAEPSQSYITSGVVWSIEILQVGSQTVTRWLSTHSSWPGYFLLLLQKPKGSGAIMGSSMGGLFGAIYQQILGIYGIKPSDTPGIAQARLLNRPEPELDTDFSILTSNPAEAESLLNPWVIHPLQDWALRHPMRTIQASGQPGQLVVLLSPNGIMVATLGILSQEQKDELINLGVELAKSWGGTYAGAPASYTPSR